MATMEKGGTTPGVVMGTAGYMSPEQAKGQTVDFRADQFAFGAILYEMLTGKRAFQRETGAETISAVLRDEPQPLAETHPNLSPHLRVIVERCLAKDAEERYAATLDLAKDLKSMDEPSAEKPRPRFHLLAIAGVLMAVLALIIGLYMLGLLERSPQETSPRIGSLVVLPLDNLSGDPDQEYFADGMTEVLTSDLAKISAIKVISRTSAMRYKGTDKPLPEIAQELNVDGVVEGSVMRAGDRVRITAQLIEAATDQHVWSESYERDLREVLSLQSEVAQAIAREIEAKLTAKEESLLMGGRAVNPEAYEAYLRGHYHLDRRSVEDIRKSIEYFEKAIEIDPNYTGGYSGLAAAYLHTVVMGYSSRFDLGPEEALSKAETAALKGVELDDTDAGTHASLGWVRLFTWEWAAAEQEFKKAIELNPGNAAAHRGYANYLFYFGDQQESLAETERALELDPLSLSINADAALHLLSTGRLDEAIEQSERTLELYPDFYRSHGNLASAYEQKGLHELAVEEWKKAFTLLLGSSAVAEVMETGYAESGYEGAMLAGAQKLKELSERQYVKPFFIALFYAEAEQKEEALRWLEKAYEERDYMLVSLKTERRWDLLRSDPRFQDLLRRLNFPE
jgi:TolB-like protein/Tfp pilus assembly protein PilF